MPRVGLELSPAACRLVELEGRLDRAGAPRVESFAIMPPAGSDTDAMIASLKGRDAAVLVWGTPSEHRQVVVTGGSYEAMRREAVDALASVGVRTNAALADIAPIRGAAGKRRPVVVAVAAADPMLDAVRPLLAAGVRVRSLATPAMALASLAATRRGVAAPAPIEAYIAVEETATCIALMRDGALAIAHELSWGYLVDGTLRSREEIIERLATELDQYVEAVGAPSASQVCICGGVPELRTMAAMLTERIDLEIEPLDSLFAIDESRLPEPVADFRERIAELRLAWAVAADWPPLLNLMRARRRQRSRRAFAAAAIVAGIAAGVGGAWRFANSASSSRMTPTARAAPPPRGAPSSTAQRRPATPPTTAGARSGTPAAAGPAPAAAPAATRAPAPLVARSIVGRSQIGTTVAAPQRTLTPELVATLSPPPPIAPAVAQATPAHPRPTEPAAQATPRQPVSTSAAAPPPRIAPPPPVLQRSPVPPPSTIQTTPPVARSAPSASASAPATVPSAAAPATVPPTATAVPPLRPRQPPPEVSQRPARPRPASPSKPEPIFPFDASLETILYGSDRKLAIVDGRIVGVGDTVRGARIIDISPTAVLLRDGDGRLRQLALGAGRR